MLLHKIGRNKKGLSEIISYVILIVIAMSLSIGVYAWLKSSIWKPQEKCPDSASLIIDGVKCDSIEKTVNLTVKNMGTWNIDGFIVRVANKSGQNPIYMLGASDERTRELELGQGKIFFINPLAPEESESLMFDYANLGNITKIEIEPIIYKEERIILCGEAIVPQEVNGC